MNIDQATRLSIVEFLSWLGHRPVTQKGRKFWYVSPFRNETKPSFKVNMEINMWYDFGEARAAASSRSPRDYTTPTTCPWCCVAFGTRLLPPSCTFLAQPSRVSLSVQ